MSGVITPSRKTTIGLLFGVFMLAVLLLSACQSASQGNTGAKNQAIAISNSEYNPKQVSVPVGTTVVWTNNDSIAHTVTADDKSFDSGSLAAGATYQFTFTKAGTFPYYCTFHGGPNGVGMSGVITVTGQ